MGDLRCQLDPALPTGRRLKPEATLTKTPATKIVSPSRSARFRVIDLDVSRHPPGGLTGRCDCAAHVLRPYTPTTELEFHAARGDQPLELCAQSIMRSSVSTLLSWTT